MHLSLIARISLALALGAAATGCGASFALDPPAGFVKLEESDSQYDFRATSADGLVLAVRELDHEPKGELSFWVRVVENHLRQRGGYALLEKRPVKTAEGLDGVQLRFGHDEGSTPHLYHVTVFVTPKHIFLLEAGGTKDLMTREAAQLDAAVQAFRVK